MTEILTKTEARLYGRSEESTTVQCQLCSFRCRIAEGKRGICGVRENTGGVLYSLVYGKLIAEHIDPVEKKPLFHFHPGTSSYSIATVGCNFRCLHCQNSDISQMPKTLHKILGEYAKPDEVVLEAVESGCSSISYTYTEPTIFFEYAYDVGVQARQMGLKNIFVTNGYMTRECLDEARVMLDAANVDIKAFTDEFYGKVCGAKLAPVLDTIEYMRSLGIWVEVTTLIIPTMNDSDAELREIARWMYRTDKTMPWHLSAFHPTYRLTNIERTPAATLKRAREIGLEEGLRYVYTGNVPGLSGESTYCYNCKALLIDRLGFGIRKNLIADGKCPGCDTAIDGVGL